MEKSWEALKGANIVVACGKLGQLAMTDAQIQDDDDDCDDAELFTTLHPSYVSQRQATRSAPVLLIHCQVQSMSEESITNT